eukprot:jgi/Ulvmu1/693/UM010_0065.1
MRWHAVPKRQAGACVSLSKHRSLTTWILVAACAVYSLLLIASSCANLPFKRGGRGLSISRDGREHVTAARSEKDARETNEEAHEQWRRSAAMYPSVDCSCEAYEALSSPAALRASTQQNTTTASSLQDTMAPQRIDTSSRQLSPSAGFLSEAYVISLASRPDRRQYMCAVLQRLGVPALLWPAISADDQQVSSIRQDLVQERKQQVQLLEAHHSHAAEQGDEALTPQGLPTGADRTAWKHLRQHDEVLTAGEVACYASHRAVWRDAAARDATGPLLVLEDDVDPEAGFVAAVRGALARLPQEWDVLWVGSCYEETLQAAAPEKVAHRLYRAKGPMCTHAYLLRSSAAAAALLRHAGNMTDPWAAVDHAMLRAVRTSGMHAYVMLPPPVAQLPHDVPPPLPPPLLQPPQPPSARLVSYNDRVAAKQQQRQQQRHGGTLAFPRPGAPHHNPSTVRKRRSWLPRQRIVHPVRELLLSEEAVAAGAAAGATWNRTCGLPIFALQLPPGTPPAAMAFGDGEYLP